MRVIGRFVKRICRWRERRAQPWHKARRGFRKRMRAAERELGRTEPIASPCTRYDPKGYAKNFYLRAWSRAIHD